MTNELNEKGLEDFTFNVLNKYTSHLGIYDAADIICDLTDACEAYLDHVGEANKMVSVEDIVEILKKLYLSNMTADECAQQILELFNQPNQRGIDGNTHNTK